MASANAGDLVALLLLHLLTRQLMACDNWPSLVALLELLLMPFETTQAIPDL